ncbi:MAG: 4Fe-4S dicluster domain-containing protein [Parasporobacterium sp.]|nr:4Fe-4S dicluster domain-containing protein [Parasporobacterium sp.]
MKFKILRQKAPNTKPYYETFDYDGPMDSSVAGALDYINYKDDIVNDKGQASSRISWECSCLQAMCGSCAMVINNRPALACETFLKDLKEINTIEPLKKFMTVCDLVVDRSIIAENLLKAKVYKTGEVKVSKKDYENQYTIAKCLKCGLCLEVCPNYTKGNKFYGASFANDCYLIKSTSKSDEKELKAEFDKHFAASCSKSLSCMDVCPMNLPTLASIARMSRNKAN